MRCGNSSRRPLGAGAALAALFLRKLLDPLLGADNPYHAVWLAVVFCAWYCGIGPSILTVVVSVVGVWYRFLPPTHSFGVKDQMQIFGIVGFLILAVVIVALGEFTRRIMARRQQAEAELRKTRDELESRVQERTASLEEKSAEAADKAAMLDLANDAIFVLVA